VCPPSLFYASEYDNPQVVKTLLDRSRGRDLLAVKDLHDDLPLHVACARGNVDCVKLLLNAGADIDNKNEDEQTPLHLAALNGRTKVVELILRSVLQYWSESDWGR
jgi:ankyrin repeat protein